MADTKSLQEIFADEWNEGNTNELEELRNRVSSIDWSQEDIKLGWMTELSSMQQFTTALSIANSILKEVPLSEDPAKTWHEFLTKIWENTEEIALLQFYVSIQWYDIEINWKADMDFLEALDELRMESEKPASETESNEAWEKWYSIEGKEIIAPHTYTSIEDIWWGMLVVATQDNKVWILAIESESATTSWRIELGKYVDIVARNNAILVRDSDDKIWLLKTDAESWIFAMWEFVSIEFWSDDAVLVTKENEENGLYSLTEERWILELGAYKSIKSYSSWLIRGTTFENTSTFIDWQEQTDIISDVVVLEEFEWSILVQNKQGQKGLLWIDGKWLVEIGTLTGVEISEYWIVVYDENEQTWLLSQDWKWIFELGKTDYISITPTAIWAIVKDKKWIVWVQDNTRTRKIELGLYEDISVCNNWLEITTHDGLKWILDFDLSTWKLEPGKYTKLEDSNQGLVIVRHLDWKSWVWDVSNQRWFQEPQYLFDTQFLSSWMYIKTKNDSLFLDRDGNDLEKRLWLLWGVTIHIEDDEVSWISVTHNGCDTYFEMNSLNKWYTLDTDWNNVNVKLNLSPETTFLIETDKYKKVEITDIWIFVTGKDDSVWLLDFDGKTWKIEPWKYSSLTRTKDWSWIEWTKTEDWWDQTSYLVLDSNGSEVLAVSGQEIDSFKRGTPIEKDWFRYILNSEWELIELPQGLELTFDEHWIWVENSSWEKWLLDPDWITWIIFPVLCKRIEMISNNTAFVVDDQIQGWLFDVRSGTWKIPLWDIKLNNESKLDLIGKDIYVIKQKDGTTGVYDMQKWRYLLNPSYNSLNFNWHWFISTIDEDWNVSLFNVYSNQPVIESWKYRYIMPHKSGNIIVEDFEWKKSLLDKGLNPMEEVTSIEHTTTNRKRDPEISITNSITIFQDHDWTNWMFNSATEDIINLILYPYVQKAGDSLITLWRSENWISSIINIEWTIIVEDYPSIEIKSKHSLIHVKTADWREWVIDNYGEFLVPLDTYNDLQINEEWDVSVLVPAKTQGEESTRDTIYSVKKI